MIIPLNCKMFRGIFWHQKRDYDGNGENTQIISQPRDIPLDTGQRRRPGHSGRWKAEEPTSAG